MDKLRGAKKINSHVNVIIVVEKLPAIGRLQIIIVCFIYFLLKSTFSSIADFPPKNKQYFFFGKFLRKKARKKRSADWPFI